MYAKGGSRDASGGSTGTLPSTVVRWRMRKPAERSCAAGRARLRRRGSIAATRQSGARVRSWVHCHCDRLAKELGQCALRGRQIVHEQHIAAAAVGVVRVSSRVAHEVRVERRKQCTGLVAVEQLRRAASFAASAAQLHGCMAAWLHGCMRHCRHCSMDMETCRGVPWAAAPHTRTSCPHSSDGPAAASIASRRA
jgi:hypothetical protein